MAEILKSKTGIVKSKLRERSNLVERYYKNGKKILT